ncbi:MAG: alpha-glucan family phosphorylase [Syntrophales bacterium]|jgi:phosphorylase/glycogen(starch) synthase|nr:alpha-glucan family phosphorylase [Syntrophales bacterium]
MPEPGKGYLFEVSWEVCNKVGGIYTVIASKMREAIGEYGENYFLLGPDLKTNVDFEETDEDGWARIRETTAMKDIACRFGRWKIAGEPKVILVSAGKKYNKDQLLYTLWEEHGVDSIAGGWDYIEPVMFSYACGEVIETVYNILARPQNEPAVAHFHEWMCGAGLLFLKKKTPEIATVFTTHATILGRSLAGSGIDIYAGMDHISPQREASAHNITAKYSMETASARNADCFTTVSRITTSEVLNFLGRPPDIITPNGLDIENIPDLSENRAPALRAREKLLEGASRFLRRDFPSQTKIMIISGRYEFHNKGVDVFLEALARLERDLNENEPVLVFIAMLAGHTDLNPHLQSDLVKTDTAGVPIATHRLNYEASDPILQTCNRMGFRNGPQNKVFIIFIPAYLSGYDGLINLPYYETLSGCDLGVFPSYYEPWGYTPMECAAYAVPTVTTDQAGFAGWIQETIGGSTGVIILDRKGRPASEIEERLYRILAQFMSQTDVMLQDQRKDARHVAEQASWERFFRFYLEAYAKAVSVAGERSLRMIEKEETPEEKHRYAGGVSVLPHFRNFTAVAHLPKKIRRLRELAYNIWWSWNPRVFDLFAPLDPKKWNEMENNPVKMLEMISPEKLEEASDNSFYMGRYREIFKHFDQYMEDKGVHKKIQPTPPINATHPIAYFSTEYGLHETLPIYSGGLGTLSGDHLKTASDLNIPLVGVGLLYKNGYFRQVIDQNGVQIAEYPETDLTHMAINRIQDDLGNEVQISLDLPGRTLYANIWEIKVGRVSLYLMNTDIPRNTAQDRRITDRLYAAEQRTRIEQEILLGMGGVKLLRKLGYKPRVFHINEGHSAFLLLERISALMIEEGLSFVEAAEVVRGSSIFTTHTPVEAGNERFSRELMEHYFSSYVRKTGISWSQFWELGRKEAGDDKPFFMTILALKLTHMSNAVSAIHGQISRHMWKDVWKGFHDTDIPIGHVTNGVHTMTYVAPRMRELLDNFLGLDWERNLTDTERWRKVEDIPDNLLWRTRYEVKQRSINFLRDQISRQYTKYGLSKTWREEVFSRLNPAALMIGFARRFAPYKRANMLFSDLDRLERILNHQTRPVHIVFSGKAHPNDDMGKNFVKKVVDICRDERFRGKIFFIEDYSIRVARHLVQGVDLWLNTPRRPYEASGTSGQKVTANGVLNLSVADGWWPEGYDGSNGWTIGPVVTDYVEELPNADEEDGQSLYSLLENTIIPLFYDRDMSGLPVKWIEMIKRSMITLTPKFNTERMLIDYFNAMYRPTAQRSREMTQDSFALARELAQWKSTLPMRFASLRMVDFVVEGFHGDIIHIDEPLTIRVHIDPGKMSPEEIFVEMIIGRKGKDGSLANVECVPLTLQEGAEPNMLRFFAEYTVKSNGPYSYGARVMPYHPRLSSKVEPGLVFWG